MDRGEMVVFCSNCGKELNGALKYCSGCGYKIEEEEFNKIQESSSAAGAQDSKKMKDADVVVEPYKEIPPESRIPMGAKVKSKIPKSKTCVTCNTRTDDICYFCNYAVCNQHSIKMQIFSDASKFGNAIQSCSNCATKKNGRQPTKEEAEGIGFFFNIKPYHEWKILE